MITTMATEITQDLFLTEHIGWLSKLDSTKMCFKALELQLQDGLKEFTKARLMPQVESFQNRFIRQREVIDELRHEIKQHENHLQQLDQPAHLLLLTHVNLRDQFNRFLELFVELERDFDEFLA